jgi:L-galactose dehydrogenase
MIMIYTLLGRTGFKVSKLGLGGSPLGGDFGKTTDEVVTHVIDHALDLGVNFIDTAPLYGYGESERRIGAALKGKRESVYIATKAVLRGEAYSYSNTINSVECSLRRLQTDYIDLIQLHEAEATTFEEAMNGTIAAFLKLKEQGTVRAIGVNSGNIQILHPYLETGYFDTVQCWSRYMLIDYTAREELFPITAKLNVGVINGSVLGMGILSDEPATFLQAYPDLLNEAAKRVAQLSFLRKSDPKGLVEPAMRFSLTCPDIAVTLTGTTSMESLTKNASFCDGIGLTEQEEKILFDLFKGEKLF